MVDPRGIMGLRAPSLPHWSRRCHVAPTCTTKSLNIFQKMKMGDRCQKEFRLLLGQLSDKGYGTITHAPSTVPYLTNHLLPCVIVFSSTVPCHGRSTPRVAAMVPFILTAPPRTLLNLIHTWTSWANLVTCPMIKVEGTFKTMELRSRGVALWGPLISINHLEWDLRAVLMRSREGWVHG